MDPILETERLVVRRWAPDDAEVAFAIYGNPEVMRYVGTGHAHPSVEHTQAVLARVIARYAEQPGLGFWAVDEKASGRLVGGAALLPLPGDADAPPEIEVAYHLAHVAWGQGYATEIARACVRYGFERLGLKRIIGLVYPENAASRRVLEKAGLAWEGRDHYFGHELDRFACEVTTRTACASDDPIG